MQKSSSLSSTATSIPSYHCSNDVNIREHSRTNTDSGPNPRNTQSTECNRYIETESMSVVPLDIESGLNKDAEFASTRNRETLKICRLCHKNNNFSETQPTHSLFLSHVVSSPLSSSTLISPCKCRTSHHYVHIGCLEQWQNTQTSSCNYTVNNNSQPVSFPCEKCGFKYGLYRPKLAKIVLHWTSKQFYTTILLLFAVLLASIIAHFVIKFLITNGMHGKLLSGKS